MKKTHKHLTGIVFLIALMAAGGCQSSNKKETNGEEGAAKKAVEIQSPDVDIFMRAVEIDGSLHLEMYDSKKDSCPAIDGLITEVVPGNIVRWKKAPASNIAEIVEIRLLTDNGLLFNNEVQQDTKDGLLSWMLLIPEYEEADTIKYEVHFTVPGHADTTVIDPYLKLPKRQ